MYFLGVHIVPGRWHSKQTTAVGHCRPLFVSAASLCSSRTEPQRNSSTDNSKGQEEALGPEYIPRRKAKNPMMPVGYAWSVYTFNIDLHLNEMRMFRGTCCWVYNPQAGLRAMEILILVTLLCTFVYVDDRKSY